MTIERLLHYVGILFIIGGIIGGIASYAGIDKDEYEIAKEVADELYDNEIAQAEYQALKAIHQTEVSMALSILFGGIITGLLFLGFAKNLANQTRMIELLSTTKINA